MGEEKDEYPISNRELPSEPRRMPGNAGGLGVEIIVVIPECLGAVKK